jgi:hypothetical protein
MSRSPNYARSDQRVSLALTAQSRAPAVRPIRRGGWEPLSRPVRLRPSIRRWSRAGFLRNPQGDRIENQWRVSICSQVPRRSWCPELAPMPRILGLPARRLHRRPRRQLRRLLWAAARRGAIVQDGTHLPLKRFPGVLAENKDARLPQTLPDALRDLSPLPLGAVSRPA